MKRNYIILTVLPLLLGFSSCQHTAYQMTTHIYPDGSCMREIRTQSSDSAFLTGDTTRHPFPFKTDASWQLNCYDSLNKQICPWPLQTVNNQKYTLIASRKFRDVESMSQACKAVYGPWQGVDPEIRLQKKFRWFYTYYEFSETYPQHYIAHQIPLSRYLTPEEQKIWYQGDTDFYKGNNGLELYDYLTDIEQKTNRWFNHNIFAETYSAIQKSLPDNPFAARFSQARDSIFEQYKGEYDRLATIIHPLNKYFKTEYFSKIPEATQKQIDSLLDIKWDSLDLYNINFRYELALPGKILSSNTQVMENNKLIWKLDAYHFLPDKYILTASSRKTNLWAFAITGAILCILVFFIIRKKGPFF